MERLVRMSQNRECILGQKPILVDHDVGQVFDEDQTELTVDACDEEIRSLQDVVEVELQFVELSCHENNAVSLEPAAHDMLGLHRQLDQYA